MSDYLYRLVPSRLRDIVDHVRRQLIIFRTLAGAYGQFRSIRAWNCLDSSGKPIPWYTYPAIEYLDHLDFSGMNVFEYGSGNSTLWWAQKADHVAAVEDNAGWYRKVSSAPAFSPDKIRYRHEPDKDQYVKAVSGDVPDVVVIDGNHRLRCAEHVMGLYEQGGGTMLIFDNSDWYPKTIDLLRKRLNWVQADFHGFGPINPYTWTTTIFINPKNLSRIRYRANLKSIAGTGVHADDE